MAYVEECKYTDAEDKQRKMLSVLDDHGLFYLQKMYEQVC